MALHVTDHLERHRALQVARAAARTAPSAGGLRLLIEHSQGLAWQRRRRRAVILRGLPHQVPFRRRLPEGLLSLLEEARLEQPTELFRVRLAAVPVQGRLGGVAILAAQVQRRHALGLEQRRAVGHDVRVIRQSAARRVALEELLDATVRTLPAVGREPEGLDL